MKDLKKCGHLKIVETAKSGKFSTKYWNLRGILSNYTATAIPFIYLCREEFIFLPCNN